MPVLSLSVPEGFRCSVPEDWSPEDNALLIECGVSVVKTVKERGGEEEGGHDRVFEALRHILSSETEEVRRENESLRRERDELRERLIKDSAERRNLENELTVRLVSEQEAKTERSTSSLRATVSNLEEQLRSSTQSLEVATRTNGEMLSQARTLQGERDELKKKVEEMSRPKTSNESGSENERLTLSILQEDGLFVRDTSKGSHNTFYHDKLVSRSFLHMDDTSSSLPRYRSEGGVVMSFEDKCYKSSNHLGEQITKFHEVRRSMQTGGRADCFLWYSTVSIPRREHRRKSMEYEQTEDGRFSVTGWIGAPDVSREELLSFVREVLDQQEMLMMLKTRVPLENETIQCLSATSEHVMEIVRTQLEHVKRMSKTISELEGQRDGVRRTALEMLLREYSVLKDKNLLTHSDTSLDDCLSSLDREKRNDNCKVIKDKDDFLYLRTNLRGGGGGGKRRKQ